MTQQIRSVQTAINNRVTTLHRTARRFISCFSVCLMPEFGKQDMYGSSMSKANKTLMATLAHCRFRDALAADMAKQGGQLVPVSEHWSTKLCSTCGRLGDPGFSRTFRCTSPRCCAVHGRDPNASKNVMALAYARVGPQLLDPRALTPTQAPATSGAASHQVPAQASPRQGSTLAS